MKVLCVFGTRPEAIKLAPVIAELRRRRCAAGPELVICNSCQHREMLEPLLDLFGIRADHDLDVMTDNQTPTSVASAVLSRLESLLREERPDWLVVQGDTTTVAAAALAAFYAGIKVAHVEAGLRTNNRQEPFPEEINRRIAGVVTDLHFAPTRRSLENLLNEGVPSGDIVVTGNTVIDALHWILREIESSGRKPRGLERFDPQRQKMVLVTAHRRENLGSPLERICHALRDLAEHYSGAVKIVYPVHLNPAVQDAAQRILGDQPHVALLPPLDYFDFVQLLSRCHLVLTDSGGIQEEAPALAKPVLVMRDRTERPEAVEAGTAKLVGTDRATIVGESRRLIDDPAAYRAMANRANPFGDGQASERIVAALLGEEVEPFVA